MKIQLIRNATMKLTYAGRTILTDPMLAPQNAYDPFVGKARNPTVEMPFPIEEVLAGVEGVLVTHYHPDHFDQTATTALPKTIPLFCQPGDEARISKDGFQNVTPIETSQVWEGVTITRTGGQHGRGQILERMGNVSGFILQAPDEPTVYWVGDSIWCEPVENAVKSFKPEIIVTHSGGAMIPGHGFIIMDDEQTIAAAKASPESVVAAIHLESLDHCEVSRQALRQKADQAGIPASRLLIPNDGETIAF